jgi:signal transduction histidine kinase
MTDIAHERVDAAPPARRRLSWTADNPLVRAIGRVRLPLGAKLIIGFALVAVLLAVGYTLGLSALGQTKSRGEQLRRLQQQAVYYQLVLTDATQLRAAISYRINSPGPTRKFGTVLDQVINVQFTQLCADVGADACPTRATQPRFAITQLLPAALIQEVNDELDTFQSMSGNRPPGLLNVPDSRILRSADKFATRFSSQVAARAEETRARANALVVANRDSYSHSRSVLLGVAVGSLALALALGLLLSWSVVAPLRRTQERLSDIAGGDFSGHVDVPNRDEIGALAADVNRMNDELRRLYGELETASRHKSDFLATMSHELRTPLNSIIGFSEVLQEQMFGELNERQLAYVNDVLEAGRHLLSLINDVLDLAKIEAGRMELDLSQVALSDLLRSAVSMHSERADRGAIGLTLTTEPEEITVTADERRVRQIVFNLLSNAIKFTPAKGRIDVTALASDGQVEIAVADTGPGIPAEDLESIFEEFEQTTEGKQVEGTGLGLPLSRKLVELHGGRLWVESQPGQGSTFRFALPTRQEAAA